MLEMLKKFTVDDAFLGRFRRLVTESVIPYQEKALRDEIPDAAPSHAIENFRLAAEYLETGHCSGEFYGYVFQDTDLAKWIEAAAYSLVASPDADLERRVDEAVDLVGRAQWPDGYLNTYFTVKSPKERWTNLQEAHELYTAGHMMEAAVAYAISTGKTKLLDIMMKMTENIYRHFIVEKAPGFPGHPEVELALLKMYELTGEAKCLELAEHFINVRGVDRDYYKNEAATRPGKIWGMNPEDRAYAQCDVPVRDFTVAEGHAVRAVYLYTAMAELARRSGEKELTDACVRVWNNIVQKQ
ncbi:MAG: glycoside hydrolase family 127 protein, partial [Clostridia bacterium]|nr:glycoside hydrolase family 127 protein [Clostridia bacterium]